jgi:hypothetical protein
MADLTVGAYFFAMQACEFCRTPRRGKTRLLQIENIQFRDQKKRVVSHEDPDLLRKAYYLTIMFVDQKNGEKFEKRTQPRSERKWLCPVRAWARAVRRARQNWEGDSHGSRTVCTIWLKTGETTTITSKGVVHSLQSTCKLFGGTNTYGFHPHELGAKSFRSGVAMSLSLSRKYKGGEIMVLGQALEWTALMARDMAQPRSFLDPAYKEIVRPQGSGRNTDNDMGIMMSPPRRR